MQITFDELPRIVAEMCGKLDALHEIIEKSDFSKQPNDIMDVHEAAALLRLSPATVYSKVSRGELPVNKQNRRIYFFRDDLIQYLKDGRKYTNKEIAERVKQS